MSNMIGTIFKLNRPMLGMPKGSMGYVFNQYQDFDNPNKIGVQIIFSNGNYDGFSAMEQEVFLEKIGVDPRYTEYFFENVMQVSRDYLEGYWKW